MMKSSIVQRVVAMPRGCTNIYLRPVSYFILFITLCTAMVALCTSDWYHYKKMVGKDEREVYMGFWRRCYDNPDFWGECMFMPNDITGDISPGMMTAIRVFYSMGIMMLLGAICYPPFYKQMSSDVIKIEVMAIFTAGGGICIFISMLLITHEVNTLSTSKSLLSIPFGYSFIMGWTAFGMCLMTASLIYIASKGNVYVEKVY